MKIFKYIALILIVWGLPSFTLIAFGESVGSNVSYFTYLILLIYYFFNEKRGLLFPFLILGIAYFIISGLVFLGDFKIYSREFIKYIIIIVCGVELARDTSKQELCLLLFLGTLSILAHSLFYADGYGRYSGFYLNPNGAAFVSLIGYCITLSIENKKIKYLYIFIFTFTGILTFSRFFFLMWLFISFVAVLIDRKNAQSLYIGVGAVILLLSVAAILQVNTERLSILESLLSGDQKGSSGLSDDSRTEQWSYYEENIYNNPIFGNGYESFRGIENVKQGVHNTYLMTIGEGGIIPFVTLLCIYLLMLIRSLKHFKSEIHLPFLAISLLSILMVMHNYFNNEFILFISIWLFTKVSNGQLVDESKIDAQTNII